MRTRPRHRYTILAGFLAALLAASAGEAMAKARVVLILPFAPVDLPREDHWLGEGVAQSLMLAFMQAPNVVQIDRERLKQLPQPESWDDSAAANAGRTLRIDLVLYGEIRRVSGDLAIHPRLVEFKGDKPDRLTLEPVTMPDSAIMDRLRTVALAYARAMKLPLSDSDSARLQKWAAPTTSSRAFEAYVRGRVAAYRGTQDGNEAAVDLLGKAVEADPQFVAAQFALGTVHQSLGNRWKAAAQFRASTQLDPAYPEPYKALGDLFLTA